MVETVLQAFTMFKIENLDIFCNDAFSYACRGEAGGS